MNLHSESKNRILSEISQNNLNLPKGVLLISEKAYSNQATLKIKFKNLEDPLGFIRNEKLQKLAENTEEAASTLKKKMEEIS